MSAELPTFNRGVVRPLECLREGWRLIRDQYWLFLSIALVGTLLGQLAPLGVLMGPAMCGIYFCLLRREAGQPVTFDMLFRGFNYFVPSLIATLIVLIPVLLLVGVFYVLLLVGLMVLAGTAQQQPSGEPDPVAAWVFLGLTGVFYLVAIVVGLVVSVLFFFTYPLIVDRGLSGPDAVRTSARAALGNFGGVLGVVLLSSLLSLLGLLACYVGMFFELPIGLAMVAIAYRQVFPPEESVAFPPEPGRPPAAPEQTGIQTLGGITPAGPRAD